MSALRNQMLQNRVNNKVPQDDLTIILAIQWSDDFETNTSVKSNRGSVWIKTLTFVSLDSNCNNITNTYPIAIGHKGDNHNSVKLLYLRN